MTLNDKLIVVYWFGVLAYSVYVYLVGRAKPKHAHRPVIALVLGSMMVGALWPIMLPTQLVYAILRPISRFIARIWLLPRLTDEVVATFPPRAQAAVKKLRLELGPPKP
jgi:uncharacterized membrane protein